jgi:probable phosphoglycerate mutase
MSEIWLVRHGETEWTRSGAHTGRTDIPLTETGRAQAEAIGKCLHRRRFALVLTSPLTRARETCRLAGFGEVAQVDPDLQEWNYGEYEGRTTAQIREQRPEWWLWRDGVPGGETLAQVAARAARVIEKTAPALGGDGAPQGDVLLFAHAHLLRILAACWVGLEAEAGARLVLGTAAMGILGYERETRAITRWNLSACP